jgi:zinc/manganese transport system substrate-binding protein
MIKIKILILSLLFSISAEAKLRVFTTTTNLASLVEEIGKQYVEVESLCRGTQDPHFLEAKPSFTFKLSKADLLINIGAGLEQGWLPLIIRGSRNPDLREGQKGRLEAADHVKMIGTTKEKVTRADGDVHPEGNPHFLLSPSKGVEIARAIYNRLKQLDPKNYGHYQNNLEIYSKKINKKKEIWKQKLKPGLKVISYHKTLSYFYHDFNITNVDVLEPKPGIPPTVSHILKIINKVKKNNIKKIIVENYFDDSVAKRVQKASQGVVVHTVPVAVNGAEGIKSIYDLYDHLVKVLGE